MPQMFSLNWILLFFYFSMILYLFISMIYFFYFQNMETSSSKISKKTTKNYWNKCW